MIHENIAFDVRHIEPDVPIVVDSDQIVVMPGRSGRELVRELQAGSPGLRVLLTSGYEEQPEPGGGPDATSFIAKPYEPATLVSRVREVLGPPVQAP